MAAVRLSLFFFTQERFSIIVSGVNPKFILNFNVYLGVHGEKSCRKLYKFL